MIRNLILPALMICMQAFAPRGDWTDRDYDQVDRIKQKLYYAAPEQSRGQGRSVRGLLHRLLAELSSESKIDELSLREILVIQKVSSFYRFSRGAAAIVPAGTAMENFDEYIRKAKTQIESGQLTTMTLPQIEKMTIHNRWGNEANHAGFAASAQGFAAMSEPLKLDTIDMSEHLKTFKAKETAKQAMIESAPAPKPKAASKQSAPAPKAKAAGKQSASELKVTTVVSEPAAPKTPKAKAAGKRGKPVQ